jgi:hypothetical protein
MRKLLLFAVWCALLASAPLIAGTASAQTGAAREVTILYTNDFHSAFDPIPAYWLPGEPRLGGAAQLAALIDEYRRHERTTFLFDSGDMFTGQLSFLTRGECHTNTVESAWSLFKRSIVGSYHQISEKHLDRYLDEFEFRFNNRNNHYLFRDTLLRLVTSENLEYKELTKEEAA